MRGALKYNLLGVGGWSPAQLDAYMASLTDGLYYDTTKLDRFFQEDRGTTLADDVGEAIGLALDSRLWGTKTFAELLAAQPEIVVNGGFDTAASWNFTPNWSISGGALLASSVGAFGLTSQPYAFAADRAYKVTYTINALSAGSVRVNFINGTQVNGTERFSPGTYTDYLTAKTGNNTIAVQAASSGFTGSVDNVSIKEIPGNHALQTTGTLKPVRQTTGAKFDGSDDNWLTPYLAGAGSNFIVALVDIPASIAATQMLIGANEGSDANRFRLCVSTAGAVRAAVGNTAIHDGTGDVRGQMLVIGMTFNGTTVDVFADASNVGSFTQSGTPTTSIPCRIGARNDNGGAGSFFAGSIKKLVAGRDYLSLTRYQQIRTALLAA